MATDESAGPTDQCTFRHQVFSIAKPCSLSDVATN
jgi:hypothetical protein